MAELINASSDDSSIPALTAINQAGGAAAQFTGDVIANGMVTAQSAMLGRGLDVGAGVSIAAGMEVGAGVSVGGGLEVAGEATLAGGVVTATLSVQRGVDVFGGLSVAKSIEVGGDIVLMGADGAEYFSVASPCEPGCVVVLDNQGRATPCRAASDPAALGVVSGAGSFRPAIRLDAARQGSGAPIAMFGKVYCKVDAAFGAISPGDLLTTSTTEGHAMRVSPRDCAPGTIVGKALAELREGTGFIPILVYRQ